MFTKNPHVIKKFYFPDSMYTLHGLVNPSRYLLIGKMLKDTTCANGFVTTKQYEVNNSFSAY